MSDNKDQNKLWGGRFTEATDAFVERFTASIEFDRRLYQHDIDGSIAHSKMLHKVGILSDDEQQQIHDGLESIRAEIKADTFTWSVALEDVHMNIEAALTSRIGDVGKKLHTGRSRNDQVATDLRLYVRDEIDQVAVLISKLQLALVNLAEAEADTIMPGFTHLQTAQPISFGHHMLAWNEMLERDYARLLDCRKRVNQSPLGAAALAGTTYPIDREYTAQLLGFDAASKNSLDSVSDRDFTIELAAFASILMMHLSRFSEELVLWTSAQFAFIDLPDRFCTGSSIMPQKKNPDVPELVRGKTGRVYGHLTALLTLMKSQPLAYNKDNQEDKEPVFDLLDTVKDCLYAYSEMMPAVSCNKDVMYLAAKKGYSTATDLADYLVKKGMAFRDAHEVVGKSVAFGIEQKRDLSELTLDELKSFSDLIEDDVFQVLTLEGSINARNHIGGTAPEQVHKATKAAKSTLNAR
ncbi:MAG: argininosuccinate lyase [SAR86 cluster bacterium]|uniref:Argininosuccinate lyase n=1 Tax=SAR86 cluster bacterium TaxID=2030880 RepID=A0A2A5B9L9_9GAMM|nr:MAG: argininosuccinate lyase [SAR86 cluster bacterium]